MTRPLVWVPRPVSDEALDRLSEWAEVRAAWRDADASFADVSPEVAGILLRTERVTGDMMRAAPRLRAIARHGVGLDTVDVATAEELGIRVTTTAGANAAAVAEHAVALLMAVRRGVGAAVRGAARADLTGRELSGSVLGLIGFGQIARRVAAIAGSGFGMTVLVHDPFAAEDDIRAAGAVPAALDSLFSAADSVSVHVPLTDSTRGLVSRERMLAMPDHGVVVNTSRGGIVDEEALLELIDAGLLAGAGLDVTEVEPLPDEHPLRRHPRVIVTPHIGGQTEESMRRVALQAERSLRDALVAGS